jgi:antitoxin component YwqK of YwqJK toxin-antitoxin module
LCCKTTISQVIKYFEKHVPANQIIITQKTAPKKVKINKKEYYIFDNKCDDIVGDIIFPDSLQNGIWILTFKSDTIKVAAKIKVKNGRPNGEVLVFYRSGKIKSRYFLKNNTIHGKCYLYHSNGKKYARIMFKNGHLVETYGVFWDEEGKKDKIVYTILIFLEIPCLVK